MKQDVISFHPAKILLILSIKKREGRESPPGLLFYITSSGYPNYSCGIEETNTGTVRVASGASARTCRL